MKPAETLTAPVEVVAPAKVPAPAEALGRVEVGGPGEPPEPAQARAALEALVAERGDAPTRDQMIPVLQDIQAAEGYLSAEAMTLVAESLDTPMSRVYGVATFYNQFRFAPLGEHVIEVCRGTACHVKQSLALAEHLKRRLKLTADGNSADGRYTVVFVACLGACSIAPVIKLDGDFYGHLTSEKLDGLLDEVEARDEAAKAADDEAAA